MFKLGHGQLFSSHFPKKSGFKKQKDKQNKA